MATRIDRMHWISAGTTELGSRGLLLGATEDSAGPGPDCIAVDRNRDGWRTALSEGPSHGLSFDIFSYRIVIM